jgi:hypothetical protein
MKKSILDMTNDERKIYIKQKAINKVYNKLNNKFKSLEGLRYERV